MSGFGKKYFETVKKLLPKQKPQSQVGIDIGTSCCKVVELQVTGNSSPELLSWNIEPIVSADKAKAIQACLSKLKIPCQTPSTAISGKGTLIRYVDLARMTLDDLRKSFQIEADKYFPFPIDQIYTDCNILDPRAKDNKMSVLVAAAKKELIDERISILKSLGLSTHFIGLNAVALANVFNALKYKGKSTVEGGDKNKEADAVAIVDLGEYVSNLTILINNIPMFTRDIFIGGRDLNKSISNALGIGLEDAEALKCNPGARKAEVQSALESVVLNLVSEIRLSFDYFVTENNILINQLLLFGGNAAIESLPEEFSKYLDMPVNRWNPFDLVTIHPDVDKESLKKNSARLAVALGLALY